MTQLPAQTLKNIGPVSAGWLAAIEIETLEDLQSIGVVEAYCRVHMAGYPATLHFLYALQGALTNQHWNKISAEVKQTLQKELTERTDATNLHNHR